MLPAQQCFTARKHMACCIKLWLIIEHKLVLPHGDFQLALKATSLLLRLQKRGDELYAAAFTGCFCLIECEIGSRHHR